MKIESIDHRHVIATSETVMFCLWRRETTFDAVRELHAISHRLAERMPGKIAFLTIVESGADMVSGPVRDELVRVFRGVAPSVSCSALVFEGEGFRAAAARAVTTTINQLARQPFPHHVLGRVEAAARWMETKDASIRPKRVSLDVEQIRYALDKAAYRPAF
ncbi:MAG: hypothetical protein AB8I08_09300 [Sandaracinaceae bacterium]